MFIPIDSMWLREGYKAFLYKQYSHAFIKPDVPLRIMCQPFEEATITSSILSPGKRKGQGV